MLLSPSSSWERGGWDGILLRLSLLSYPDVDVDVDVGADVACDDDVGGGGAVMAVVGVVCSL